LRTELKDEKAKEIIRNMLLRIKNGNFGEIHPERGTSAFIIDHGPGYRLYFIKVGLTVVILLCGGDKSSQDSDIIMAREMTINLKRRFKNENQ
jgi:putative addiction module killer protein